MNLDDLKRKFGFDFVGQVDYMGYVPVSKDGKWYHVLKKDGTPCYTARFDMVGTYRGDRCGVRLGGRDFLIDREGKEIVPGKNRTQFEA